MGRKKFREYGVTEVLAAMEEVVNEYGHDFVYTKPANSDVCQYMHGEQPGCLIGHVLVRLGAHGEVLRIAEGNFIDANSHGLGVEEFLGILAPTWGTLGYSLTEDAVRALTVAQNLQDCSNTWGRALEAAQEDVRSLN